MHIDMEYLRGKYFNLKTKEDLETKEIMERNTFIQQMRNNYRKQYEIGRSKSLINLNSLEVKMLQREENKSDFARVQPSERK